MDFSYYLEYVGKKEISKNDKTYYQVSFKDDHMYYNFLTSKDGFEKLNKNKAGDTFLCGLQLKQTKDFKYSLSLLDFEESEV